ncbi:Epithelial membrane protein [Operophtera brumata]|uniref:Epithelial membrane protein n=1 Tax=Operophtera brumata TaxID=104452 RepID=A0A0L7KUN8_OPEBR|nr:Epithelial membrane protein [Operophtera brumata]
MILLGFSLLAFVFVRTYKSFLLGQNRLEIAEIGRETLRRSSIVYNQRQLTREKAYHNLNQIHHPKLQELVFVKDLSQSMEEFKTILKTEFVKCSFTDVERESLLRSDNAFILSEHRNKRFSLGS